ncbi:methyltransferase domain-containing protein [bacterium]|nr:methyltransferase domain-containing protein [bacterium]
MESIFNSSLWQKRKARALPKAREHQFLLELAATRMAERLGDIQREFALAADIGCHHAPQAAIFRQATNVKRWVGVEGLPEAIPLIRYGETITAEMEYLPFAPESLDAALSLLSLQSVSDVPGVLAQCHRALRPDGWLCMMLIGGDSLMELRHSLMEAELELTGGVSPRVMPMMDVRSAGMLLQRAGFNLPVVDSETLTLTYPNMLALLRELQGMAATNITAGQRKSIPPRALFARAAEIYHSLFALPDGRIPVTLELITLAGWKPHSSQPKPAARGSAKASLTEALQ